VISAEAWRKSIPGVGLIETGIAPGMADRAIRNGFYEGVGRNLVISFTFKSSALLTLCQSRF
jgi:hypothetical protein